MKKRLSPRRSHRSAHVEALESFEDPELQADCNDYTNVADDVYERGYEDDDVHDESGMPLYSEDVSGDVRTRVVSPLFVVATTLVGAGIGLIVLWNAGRYGEELRSWLGQSGFAPIDVVLLGVVLAGIATLRSQQRHHHEHIAGAVRRSNSAATLPNLPSQIGFLVESAKNANEHTPPELHQALHLLVQQEEKINALSNANEMYGQPLLEITTEVSKAGRQIAELSSQLDAVKQIAERLEAAKPSQSAELAESLRRFESLHQGVSDEIQVLASKLGTDGAGQLTATLANLERQIERIRTGDAQGSASTPNAPPAASEATTPQEPKPKGTSSSVMSAIARLKQLRT